MRRAAAALCVATLLVPAHAGAAPRERPEGHGMTVAGATLVVAGVLSYIGMAVGLGLGNTANADVRSLQGPDDIERRRDAIARGRLGNRLAIGFGVSAGILIAAGIPLIVVGRRRARASTSRGFSVAPTPNGAGISYRVRF